MCFRVDCKQCGKYSRGGYGKHLSSVYANIERGKHCMCRSWPGVFIPVDLITTEQPPLEASSTSTIITGTQKS